MTAQIACTDDTIWQWKLLRFHLPIDVILARAVIVHERETGDRQYLAGPLHILALQDFTMRAPGMQPKDGSRANGRIIIGLDSISRPMPAEACFCATDSTLYQMRFEVWHERHQQRFYAAPTCRTCWLVGKRIITPDRNDVMTHRQ